MKSKCDDCDQIAVWFYMPSDWNAKFCDNHVSRGCSCNLIIDENGDNTEEYDKDELGRDLPCVEYMFFEDGCDEDS